jgi:hypothetical protein
VRDGFDLDTGVPVVPLRPTAETGPTHSISRGFVAVRRSIGSVPRPAPTVRPPVPGDG